MPGSIIPISDEQAKFGQEALKFIDRVLGEPLADAVGLLGGNWLHERCIRQREALRRRTEQILRDRDVEEVIEPSPNIAVALIAGAQVESRDELVDLWARLLANAMDPKLSSIRREFIDAVKKMNPSDALVIRALKTGNFQVIKRLRPSQDSTNITGLSEIGREIGKIADEVEVSLMNLTEIGMFDQGTNVSGVDKSAWYLNVFARQFMRVCYPELTG